VTPWKIGRGWSPGEIQAQLAALGNRSVSFETLPGGLPVERAAEPPLAPTLAPAPGWTVERFEASLGLEPPGPPRSDGLFARAREALCTYRFADPRITRGYADPHSPLPGRDLLVDVHALVLRFLVGLRVGAVLDRVDVENGAEQTRFGIRLDTLEGHLLHGSEWVQVAKDHQSGAVRLRIESRWRPAPLPAWWMGLGFRLLGRRLQARWRRQVARRLRALA
jgi:uncharacterized protein (UPF0548 family)